MPAKDFAPASTARKYDGGTSPNCQTRPAASLENPVVAGFEI